MQYFLIKPNGEQTGTYSIDQIRQMLGAGYIDQDTRYWHEGITEWQPIDRIEESLQFEPPPPVPLKTVAPQKLAAVLKAVPPPATKLEKTKLPGVQPKQVEERERPSVPAATRGEYPQEYEDDDFSPRELSAAPSHVTVQSVPEPRPKIPRILDRLICVVIGAALTLGLMQSSKLQHYFENAFSSKVTLSPNDTFVLFQPAAIKSFTQDMRDSPMVETLKNQIDQTADPAAQQRLTIDIQTENARHADEVRQQYLHSNSAEFVDPGAYRILGYFNSDGDPITPSANQPAWVAINYKDHTVYAFKSGDSGQATP